MWDSQVTHTIFCYETHYLYDKSLSQTTLLQLQEMTSIVLYGLGLALRGLGVRFIIGGVSELSDQGITFGSGGPKKVEILWVGRQFPLPALLMCCLLSLCTLKLGAPPLMLCWE